MGGNKITSLATAYSIQYQIEMHAWTTCNFQQVDMKYQKHAWTLFPTQKIHSKHKTRLIFISNIQFDMDCV